MARPRLSSFGVRRAGALAGLSLSCLVGCDGDLINLGSSEPLALGGEAGTSSGGGGTTGGAQAGSAPTPEWMAQPVVLVQEGFSLANPTLTAQSDRLFFSRQKRGFPDPHIYVLEASGGTFRVPAEDAPSLMLSEDAMSGASSPAVSASGDELWFGMGVAGTPTATDVYVTYPESDGWSPPVRVDELSSLEDDAPRPPGLHGLVMPLSSKRHGGDFYQIYFATRDAVGSPWHAPNQDDLATINSGTDTSVDGFLTDDGLTLYFASTRGAVKEADLFRARRASANQPFGEPEALLDIQRDADERDPWLSEDGNWLYYSSNRTGLYAIYRARHVQ